MSFPDGCTSSRREWSISGSLPQKIEEFEGNAAPRIKEGFFGRKIGNCRIDEVINGMNLIVLDNFNGAALEKMQTYTENFKGLLQNNLGWKDRILAHFGSKTQLTSERMEKLGSLISKMRSAKELAFKELRQPLALNPEMNRILTANFREFDLPTTANGYDLYKAFRTTGYSKQKRLAYNAIVEAKKWSLPRFGKPQRMG
jgi:hypothetical protein